MTKENIKTPRASQTRTAEKRPTTWTPPSSLDAPPAPAGFRHRWIRTEVLGFDDTKNMTGKMRSGWELVRADEYPGSIYPIPDDVDNTTFMWQVTPIKKLTEEESKKYPDPNNIGKYLENYIDFENSVNFPKDKFTEAFKHFVNISYESINN